MQVSPFSMVMPNGAESTNSRQPCFVCNGLHAEGYCPVKLAGVEYCGLCGIAHYGAGFSRNCPHLNSVTQCRAMLETLKSSAEPQAHIDQAKKYLVGVVGNLNRKKKLKEINSSNAKNTMPVPIPPNGQNLSYQDGNENVPTGIYSDGVANDGATGMLRRTENGFLEPDGLGFAADAHRL